MRYYGHYANRTRGSRRRRQGARDASAPPLATSSPKPPPPATRASWARLLRKILEVDPLLCVTCQVEMKIVAVLTEPRVVDRILRRRAAGRGHDPSSRVRRPPPEPLGRGSRRRARGLRPPLGAQSLLNGVPLVARQL